MKYLSRCLALLLVAAMAVLAGCTGAGIPEGAFEAYTAALEKNAALKSVHVKTDIDAKVLVAGVETEIPMTMEMKMGKDGSISMNMSMSVLGMAMDVPMYYIDDVLYMEMLGMKIKMSVTDDAAKEEMNLEAVNPQLAIPEEALVNASMEKKDGNTVYTAEFDGQLIAQELMDTISSSLDSLEDVVTDNLTFGTVKYAYTIDKNGYLCRQELDFSISFTADGAQASAEYRMVFEALDLGKDITPDKPADPDEYMDLSEITG